jgi:hypothetical protein
MCLFFMQPVMCDELSQYLGQSDRSRLDLALLVVLTFNLDRGSPRSDYRDTDNPKGNVSSADRVVFQPSGWTGQLVCFEIVITAALPLLVPIAVTARGLT